MKAFPLAVCAAHYSQLSLLSAIIMFAVCAAHYPQWTKSFPAQQASTFGDQVWISYFVCTMCTNNAPEALQGVHCAVCDLALGAHCADKI